ncbi:MAG: hypothetical protein ACXVZ2_03005 [Gaiellaceae bacterium]
MLGKHRLEACAGESPARVPDELQPEAGDRLVVLAAAVHRVDPLERGGGGLVPSLRPEAVVVQPGEPKMLRVPEVEAVRRVTAGGALDPREKLVVGHGTSSSSAASTAR